MNNAEDNGKSCCPSLWLSGKEQPGANQLLKKNQHRPLCRSLALHYPGLANHHKGLNALSPDEHRPSKELKLLWQWTTGTTMLHNKLPPKLSGMCVFMLTLQNLQAIWSFDCSLADLGWAWLRLCFRLCFFWAWLQVVNLLHRSHSGFRGSDYRWHVLVTVDHFRGHYKSLIASYPLTSHWPNQVICQAQSQSVGNYHLPTMKPWQECREMTSLWESEKNHWHQQFNLPKHPSSSHHSSFIKYVLILVIISIILPWWFGHFILFHPLSKNI